MSKNVYGVCFCVFLYIMSVLSQLEEGADCVGEADGIKGKCVSIRHCLSIVSEIKRKIHPQMCSFRGREPIVCCTDCELFNDTSTVLTDKYGYSHYFKTGRKAVDRCLENMLSLDYWCPLLNGIERKLDTDKQCYQYERNRFFAAVGGVDALVGQYPHMALLGYGDSLDTAQWLCGGSVISDRFILTAAHCIGSNALGPVRYVGLGILKRSDPPERWQRYIVSRIIPHPQYKAPNKYHDIALLETGTKIQFSKLVLPACLNTGNDDESYATATGWGALGHRKTLADTLQIVFLSEFTPQECAAQYPPHRHLKNGYDHNTQMCYGDKDKITDTCEGDSGGPLQRSSELGICIYKILGVTSYGRPCGFTGGVGMYTRVAYYVPWIESIVWP